MIETYIGEKPLHTHENTGLEDFLVRLEPIWGSSVETITVIANALWNNAEIDLVCILPRAILVADFKNYSGQIEIAENGPWKAESGYVKGGAKDNPFVQIRDNKRALINWFEYHQLLASCNLGHITGAIIFTQPVTISGDLGPKNHAWFYVTDLDHCAAEIAARSSPQLLIKPQQMQEIVSRAGVRRYQSTRQRSYFMAQAGVAAPSAQQVELSENQQEVLEAITRFLQNPDRHSFSVLGMTYTGKTLLLQHAVQAVEKMGRQPIILAPNARNARCLEEQHDLKSRSVYAHLFTRAGAKSEKTIDRDSGAKRTLTVYPLRQCFDPEDCVYLIDDAHLICNDHMVLSDNSRYGSGHIFDDLVQFAGLKSTHRQVLLFGDPYQLSRGRRDAMPLFGDVQRARGLESIEARLTAVRIQPAKEALLFCAKELASAIDQGRFSILQIESGPGLTLMDKTTAGEQIKNFYQQQVNSVWYIADNHELVGRFNRWMRRILLQEEADQSVAANDLLEVFYSIEAEVDPLTTSAHIIASGDRVTVEAVCDPSTVYVQPLQGRPEPIKLHLRDIAVHSGFQVRRLTISEDFLLAEKPELEADTAIAFEVWQKAHADQSVVSVRYGYASTAHHALGFGQPICFVNADTPANRHSEGYFRWLYTAITRASEHCILLNFEELGPLDAAQWKDGSGHAEKKIRIGGGWQPSTAADFSRVYQQALRIAVQELLSPLGWQIKKAYSALYQEKYTLQRSTQTAVLFVHYSESGKVMSMRDEEEPTPGLLLSVCEAAAWLSISDANGLAILNALRRRAEVRGLRIVGASRDGEFRLTLTLASTVSERVQLELNHDKEGSVSVVRPIKYTSAVTLQEVRELFPKKGIG